MNPSRPRAALCAALCAVLLAVASCSSTPEPKDPGKPMVATQLHFGLSKPDGTVVTTEQYQEFLSTFISERFPDGLTAIAGRGQWRDQKTQRIVAEDCRVLVLVHEGSARSERHVREIVAEYKRLFEQDAVMRVDYATRVSF